MTLLDSRSEETTLDDCVLEVDGVSIQFGGVAALKGVSFRVHAGEVVGLIGPNGAGKSTMLNCICGFYRPTAGRVRVDGTDTVGTVPHLMRSRGVARTFQETLLIDDLSLIDNVMLGRTVQRRRDLLRGVFTLPGASRHYREQRERAAMLLEEYGLRTYTHTAAGSVPYGVRKLAEVARAQFAEPRLLLLDEPAAGLGPVEAENLADRLASLAASGIAVVLIDHNMDFVARAADRVVVMSAGALLAEGTPTEIRQNQLVTEAYLGRGRGNRA
ncbi:ABC transporter ATP-binding protein [Microbacterium sp. A93]|uniref:ABC transporter ATP-binding protein n=1 Tax=Microbacterium sp. A93 TaxID=3450716 RepID=UPI003F42584F